ncbi:MAG: hypothetical protein ACI4M5_00845 [Christensenellales bacterium]
MKKSMLLSTIAMIVVVVVALSTATFAWFTASTQAAITSDFTVEATKMFNMKTYTAGAWTVADTIDISATKLKPVAPIAELSAATQVGKGTDVDAAAVVNAKDAWFTVTKDGENWTDFLAYTVGELQTAKVATVAPFQLSFADATMSGQATFAIDLEIIGQTAADWAALKSVNVVVMVESYDDGAVEFVGTQYNVQNPATDVTLSGNDASLTASPAKTFAAITTTGLAADPSDSLTNHPNGTSDGIKISYTGDVQIDAAEVKLVTAFVWLDGYQAADEIMSKVVKVNIGITKKA